MPKQTAFSTLYVPKEILDNYTVSEAFVAKVGFLRFELTDAFGDAYFREKKNLGTGRDKFIDELYSLLSNSPHIMEITPHHEELSEAFNKGEFGIHVAPFHSALSLGTFLKLRIVMPERKREELGLFPWSWNPEEFTVHFNGALFAAYAQIDTVPISTDLGQIARDFLRETLASSEIWKHISGIGPTPMHPEFYFVRVTGKNNDAEESVKLPMIKIVKEDVVIIIPEDEPIELITESLLQDMNFAISDFYTQRVFAREFDDAVHEIEDLNQELSELLARYFELPTLRRLFASVSKDIRHLLVKMHMSLQNIAAAEMRANRAEEEVLQEIANTTFLKGLRQYFFEHMKLDVIIDKDSQLTTMNFAAQETSNFVITQATLVAALTGAIIGGLLTIAAKYVFS